MEIDYKEGTLLWYWFENWIVVGGFAVALVVAVWVAGRSGWGIGGLLLKTWMLMAVLAVLPLTLLRLGMNITVPDDVTVGSISLADDVTLGYISMAGVAGSLLIGLPYLIAFRSVKDAAWVQGVAPLYRRAAIICDNFNTCMAQDTPAQQQVTAQQQITAVRLIIVELPSLLKAMRATTAPRSGRARKARKNLQEALLRYISSAMLAEQLFQESEMGMTGVAQLEHVTSEARARIANHVSPGIASARQDIAEVGAYFERNSQ